MTRFSSEARKACVTPTDQMFTKGAARISRKKSKNSEHEVIEEEDPSGDAHTVRNHDIEVWSLSLIRIKVKFIS